MSFVVFRLLRAPQIESSILIKRLLVGAIAAITESLDGNRVFIARLLNTNSHVLVHPVPYIDHNIGRLASLNYEIVVACLSFTSPVICVRFLFGRRVEVLPCTYGYGQTIRKCQGLTLVHGCLFFDSPKFPAARGYGPSALVCYSMCSSVLCQVSGPRFRLCCFAVVCFPIIQSAGLLDFRDFDLPLPLDP